MVSADKLERYERCPRLLRWANDHLEIRVSPLSALYRGVEAGLIGEDAKNEVMKVAASPGLSVEGVETYSIAVHLSFLAEILTVYLLSMGAKWTKSGQIFEVEGEYRRIVLVDRWSEEKKLSEIRSWKTMAEVCQRDAPLLLTFMVIGTTSEHRRVSPWSRGWTHPKNQGLRFKKIDGSSLEKGWNQVWRERSGLSTERWLQRLQLDHCFQDLVHTVQVNVPRRRLEFLKDIERIEQEIATLPENPPMRRSACYQIGSTCQFAECCNGAYNKTPSECGWIKREDITKIPLDAPKYANVG